MKSDPKKSVKLYFYCRQCCGAGSGRSVIKLPPMIRIRLPILSTVPVFINDLKKFKLISSIYFIILNDLLLYCNYYTTRFFTEHKNVQVGSESEIIWPPWSGSVSVSQVTAPRTGSGADRNICRSGTLIDWQVAGTLSLQRKNQCCEDPRKFHCGSGSSISGQCGSGSSFGSGPGFWWFAKFYSWKNISFLIKKRSLQHPKENIVHMIFLPFSIFVRHILPSHRS